MRTRSKLGRSQLNLPASERRFMRAVFGHGYAYQILRPLEKTSRRIRCCMQECQKMARWVHCSKPWPKLEGPGPAGPYFYYLCGEHRPAVYQVPLGQRSVRLEASRELLSAAIEALYHLPQVEYTRRGVLPSPYSRLKAAIAAVEQET